MGEIDDIIKRINPKYSEPIWENKLIYDTPVTALEPIYYWIIDFLGTARYKLDKVIDSFTATPGSSYFSKLGMTATKMQEEGMKIMATTNSVIQSVIRILYDLRNFDQRLLEYDKLNSDNKKKRNEGLNALKQIWLSSVDSVRGAGSMNVLSQQLGFTLLRPAFMMINTPEEADKADLNLQVKRLLRPRIAEFLDWVKLSEQELRKRFEIERGYLKTQVGTLELYSRWVKPYIRAAEQLRMKGSTEASLVSVFESMILELGVIAEKETKVKEEAEAKNLPPYFAKVTDKIRGFHQIIVLDFKFRTYPTPQAQHVGRVEIEFKAYALNDDELFMLKKLREEGDLKGLLGLSETVATEGLDEMVKEIREYIDRPSLGRKKKEEMQKEEDESLFGGLFNEISNAFMSKTRKVKIETKEDRKKAEKEKEKKEAKRFEKLAREGIEEDNYEEGVVREYTEIGTAEFTFKAFDIFKKSQGMASFPSPFDNPDVYKRFRDRRAEISAASK